MAFPVIFFIHFLSVLSFYDTAFGSNKNTCINPPYFLQIVIMKNDGALKCFTVVHFIAFEKCHF